MRAPVSSFVLAAACAVPAQQSEALPPTRTLADFDVPTEGGRWRTVLDGVMGGRSTGSFVVEDGKMVFTGVLNTNGGGFSSVRRPGEDLQLGQDGEAGIHLRVRGDGRKYTLRLRQPNERRRFAASYRTQFTTRGDDSWQDVYVPYSALRPTWRGRSLDLGPVEPAKVDEVGVSIDDKIDGPFRLEIEKICTYAAFDLDRCRGVQRPLVVFAANQDDPQLQQQLRAARSDAAGFAEREVPLVVVLDDGASSADGRPLDRDACEALRARFARNRAGSESGFTALLVGKDGSVKRTSHAPLDTDALFAQIDRMPMRIQARRERRKS